VKTTVERAPAATVRNYRWSIGQKLIVLQDGVTFKAGNMVVVRYCCPQFPYECYMVGGRQLPAQEVMEASQLTEVKEPTALLTVEA
jgi:hypothetical protein